MRKYRLLIIAFIAAVLLTFTSTIFANQIEIGKQASADFNLKDAIIPQAVTKENKTEKEITTIYLKDRIIGIIKDNEKIDALLSDVYQKRYKQDFPDSKIGLGEDIHIRKVFSFFEYEDKDAQILAYLDKKDMFSVEVNKIEFSNGEVAYVKNLNDFTNARTTYLQNYIKDKDAFKLLENNQPTPPLTTYGERYTGFKVLENATVAKGLAPESRILKNEEEVGLYLSYGYNAKYEYYTTQEFDTVAGIAWLNQMTSEHLMSINSDKLKDENQILPINMKLNVSKLHSPINVEVKTEKMEAVPLYPDATKTVYDETIREGMEEVIQSAEIGSRDVKLELTYINGSLQENGSKEISSQITKAPVQEVVRVGTKVEPKIGSGRFRYPVDNAIVTCPWMCYYNHTAIDVQNAYNRYGKVLAADRGVVVENTYSGIGGYNMVINHNNGFVTYYGHMSHPGFFPVGTTVAQGEAIGDIGQTGVATGPHVHFEVRLNGVRVNPALYLQ
ncbi:MAG: peptidoglycan DD-metalloendopeptidase family protein [Erysipelotrichaceae bacterium]